MPCVEFCRMRGRIHQNAPESILSAFFAHFSREFCGILPFAARKKSRPFGRLFAILNPVARPRHAGLTCTVQCLTSG